MSKTEATSTFSMRALARSRSTKSFGVPTLKGVKTPTRRGSALAAAATSLAAALSASTPRLRRSAIIILNLPALPTPRNGGGGMVKHHGFHHRVHAGIGAAQDGAGAHPFGLALGEGLQGREDDADIRCIGEGGAVKAIKYRGIPDSGSLLQDALDLLHHLVGGLQRGTRRQLHDGNEIALASSD